MLKRVSLVLFIYYNSLSGSYISGKQDQYLFIFEFGAAQLHCCSEKNIVNAETKVLTYGNFQIKHYSGPSNNSIPEFEP